MLHSAGGKGDETLPVPCKPHHRGFYGDDTFYVLLLDCGQNRNDWWWGYEAIQKAPEAVKNQLCPAEKRVMSTIEWVLASFDID